MATIYNQTDKERFQITKITNKNQIQMKNLTNFPEGGKGSKAKNDKTLGRMMEV